MGIQEIWGELWNTGLSGYINVWNTGLIFFWIATCNFFWQPSFAYRVEASQRSGPLHWIQYLPFSMNLLLHSSLDAALARFRFRISSITFLHISECVASKLQEPVIYSAVLRSTTSRKVMGSVVTAFRAMLGFVPFVWAFIEGFSRALLVFVINLQNKFRIVWYCSWKWVFILS